MATQDSTCSIPHCGKPRHCRDWCNKHYTRWHRHGDPLHEAAAPTRPLCETQECKNVARYKGLCEKHNNARTKPPCTLLYCDKPQAARGWCAMHYTRWRVTGSLDIAPTFPKDLCAVKGCLTGSVNKGYCKPHYQRFNTTGDPGGLTFAKAAPIVNGTKKCFTCEEVKPVADFNKHPAGTGGVGSNCRLCLSVKSREWFAKNPEYRAEWNAANAERKLADVHRRRAIKMDVDADLIDRRAVFERDNNVCQLCDEPMDMSKKTPHPLAPTIDHIVPISRGGTHAMDNIQSAHFHCNISKGNRDAPLTRPLAA